MHNESDLNELYQEMIIDHGRKPRNFGACPEAKRVLEGFNPLCGDRLMLYIVEEKGVIKNICFEGSGCAISMASASMMTEAIKGKTLAEAKRLFEQFHVMITQPSQLQDENALGKLKVLSGVAQFPSRIKCVTLAWHTLVKLLG